MLSECTSIVTAIEISGLNHGFIGILASHSKGISCSWGRETHGEHLELEGDRQRQKARRRDNKGTSNRDQVTASVMLKTSPAIAVKKKQRWR